MTRISSRRYLMGSRGERCKLRISYVCTDDNATVIPAHIRDRHTGRSIKASDLSVTDACWACHEVFDRRAKMPNGEYITDEEWFFYALRGLQDTLEAREAKGLLIVPKDIEQPSSARPVKPRKPPEQRKKLPIGRKLVSRNTFKREEVK
jgi:hypothetical protein